ncbi:MAG: hypothetical protein J6K74_07780 [Marinifilaceae bacterium]|nr:hypothetical protein [Marinifilaceae bacterium]
MQDITIYLDLEPHLEDFLIHEFGVDNQGRIKLSRRTDFGRMIYANIESCDYRPTRIGMNNPVRLTIPNTEDNHYILEYRYLHFTNFATRKINDYLVAEFRQRMRLIFERGYRLKFSQKEIIEAILQDYNIRKCAITYEAIKKSDYRFQKKLRKNIANTLHNVNN